ncbi:Midasin [Cocos nucifera]|uniref:Midasin n=1 Tax=Cocos nucifera TaxID=13894 RepID=A0A8K0IM16_COCNU|nr:Midasin [Cocos nucifera]
MLGGSFFLIPTRCRSPHQDFEYLDQQEKDPRRDVKQLLDSVRVSYCFLVMEPKVFAELWDWSCFIDVPQQTCNIGLVDGKTSSNTLDIIWCSVQILSVVLRISDRATENFGLEPAEAFMCLLRWEEFCKDTSLEKAGWYLQAAEMENGSCLIGTTKFTSFLESFDNVSFINSSLHSRDLESGSRSCRNKVSCDVLSGSPYVLTPAVKKSFEMVLMALSQKWPVLLHGPAGGGKTALINKLAQLSGNRVLFIHMDEQMDSKTLVGSYICSEQPGEFRWQHGSLSQAILKGFWVVFEDIDKAPNEIQSIILPLLEGSSSFVTGHGEAISMADSFRLFATVSTSKREVSHAIEGSLPFSVLWRKVMVAMASSGDVLDILNAWYPSLECISSKLIETFEKVNSLASYRLGGIQDVGVVSAGTFSRFSLRDLLKWCRRIAGLDLNFSGLGLSASDCQIIYQEAVDIFAASLSSSENRLLMMREIARIWGIAENVYPPSKPVFQTRRSDLQVGRVVLQCSQAAVVQPKRPFVGIRSVLHVLERIACSVKYKEPVLLVGETGTGKTTLVQNLAMRLGQPVTVMNLSQQSDVADLLGGFKPTDVRSICVPLYHEFKELFCKTFSGKDNEALLRHYEIYAIEKNWKKLLHAFQKSVEFVQKRVYRRVDSGFGSKRKRPLSEDVLQDWECFSLRLNIARKQIGAAAGMSFTFVEGAFITALRSGHWILLDEINLAPVETLQRISGVLDGDKGTLCLTERGDIDYIDRHPSFRLFACMNPATDAGKRELPYSFRSRFTEYFVDDVLDDEDLTLFVNQYMDEINTRGDMSSRIVRFYKAAKSESEERLQDGANQKPQFSLRSLARALEYTKMAEKDFGFQRALCDGFCMFFLTSLDGPSGKIMNKMIVSYLLGGTVPPSIPFDAYFSEKSKPLDVSDSSTFIENYVLTRSVKEHLKNLARAVYIKRYPVLLQGPTSSGKTSLVQYLASVTGHEFVRINNHEHTDLQEYFGSYITDSFGRLQFQEGVLVKAVRKGHWIVLDELNLAPSDVLEALNRLLDDNRELFVPELQETVSAHPDFMLFATQNPPTLYGGRKMLSRAFRNRFLEIHVDEIPEDELAIILENRCKIPASYAMKMVEVMTALQLHRQNSKVFAGKHGFITPRDLFRWANRFRMFGKSYEDLARDGYLLLAERLRDENEKNVVRETLERCLRVKLIMDDLYKAERGQGDAVFEFSRIRGVQEHFGNIAWTKSMWRLYFLVERCYELREPVLLVGETGGGKTTVCQLLSIVLRARLHTLNCHQYTETSDFIGGFYPVRDRSRLVMEFKHGIERVKQSKIFLHFERDVALSSDISQCFMTISQLNEILNNYNQNASLHPGVTQQDIEAFEQIKLDLLQLKQKWQTIFLWQDGPLVQAMKDGDLFLVDEISLADDSVLERLNSVLEPERTLSLAEKGGSVLEKITAHPNFFILGTMNPGGDYGKKELSPSLRNRFTEIWVPPVNDVNELKNIAIERSYSKLLFLAVDVAILTTLQGQQVSDGSLVDLWLFKMENYGWGDDLKLTDNLFYNDLHSEDLFGIEPFYIAKGNNECKHEGFEFLAPTTSRNVLRTDMMDLLGSDLPVQGETGMEFSWSDGILLQGLNAILDHRAEVFIPELGLTFKCPPSFRIFACQNPSCQGGGRKGLPKSFLNRFTKVYVDELAADDYLFICQSRFPSIPQTLLSKLISFNNHLYEDVMVYRKYGQEGSPWEFNLRDVIRSCQIIEGAPENAKVDSFLNIVYLQRMRTVTDRKEVLKLYEAVFGLKPSITPTPRLQVNPKYLIMGNACAERNHFQPTKLLKSQINLLPGICQSLEAALHCIQQQWLCIFVGPSSSGKTSLVRLLAQLTGNELTELNLSSGTDVSELLGSFEQYNSYRSCKAVISQVERYVDEYFSLRLEVNRMDLINNRKDLFAKWFSFLAAKKNYSCMSASASAETLKTQSHSLLSPLIEIIEELKHDLELFHLPVSWSCKDLEKSLKTVLELQRKKLMQPSANFEWVAGDLIRAIDCGEWIVLDNANLCNPTVLDRINSLVEPDGSIIINECGLVDGKPVVLHAHPKFRMFLTVDPKHGEVSRAMRNRGLEIFLMQPNWLLDGEGSDDCMSSEITDVKRVLTFSGIPISKLILAMSKAHMYAKAAGLRLGVRITLLELTRWIQLFQQLLMNGNQLTWSLQLSWEHTYLSALGEAEGTDIIMQAKVSYLSDTEWYKLDPLSGCSLSLPGGWPVPHTLRNFLWYSKEACVKQNFMYLEFLGAQCASYKLNFSSDATFLFDKISKDQPSVMPANMLQVLLFPNALDKQTVKSNIMPVEFDLALVNQMLFIAANWTIEQATENDLALYVVWFKWYSSMLEPYCHFFKSFSTILEQERDHPIWNCILDGRREVVSYHKINIDEQPVPLLSKKLVELGGSDGNVKNVQKRLDNAIQCVNLLRLTYKQWNAETDYSSGEKSLYYLLSPVLNSLRCLESEVLKIVAESKKLLQIFSNILEYHLSFWKSITSSHFEYLVQLLSFCNAVWPRKKLLKQNLSDGHLVVEAVLSTNIDLRHLAMQGVCMSSYITTKGDQETANAVAQLEELHQRLLNRQSGFSSWLVIVPLFDIKSFSLDIKLLQEFSKCISANACEVHQLNVNLKESVWYDTSPFKDVKTKFANFLLELWFKYHSSLWNHWSGPLEISSRSGYDESCHLVYPTRTATIDMIIQCTSCIKDYDVNCLKLRVVSRCLWQDTPLQGDLIGVLHSAADSLFKQILLVHEKSFDKGAFSKIKSILCSLLDNGITQEELQVLRSLISSSSHGVLTSLLDLLIEPLLKELYFECPSHDSLYNLGCAWLHIGALRFHLLLNSDGPDPAMKYVFKYSQILEKIALLELEIKVRLECEQLAGRISTRDDDKQRVSSLQNLEEERNRLQAKVVFRPEPQKYKSLRSVCDDFRKLASSCMELIKNLKCNADLSLMINVACNWQVTSASFIKRLSEEFAEYVDLIQPVQVAVYEMKLGLSLVVSSALEGEYLKKVEEDNIERILATIYSYMEFPKGLPVGGYPVELIDRGTENIAFDMNASASILSVDFNLLKKLIIMSSEISPDKSVSLVQLQTTIHHIMLIHVAHHVCCSLVMDKASFLLLDDIFGHFTSLWMNMKSQKKAKEDGEAQHYKFRPRSVKIEDILVGDISQLSDLDSDGPLTFENEEILMQQEFTGMRKSAKEDEAKEEEWDLIFDNILKSMVLVHNELFGSSNLVEQPGIGPITDEQRLHSFTESYRLGTRIIKDLQALRSSILDDNLMPEHLLRICLEYEQTLGISCQPTHVYNIYKDSNASVMHKMVKPLTVIQEQVKYFLIEWPDHPGLQKILDATDTLLAIPLNTPLSKALLGLQLLVGRAQSLQENASRFSLKNELQPIYGLVSSWQKLELDCWPALLDDVQKQYEINAGKFFIVNYLVMLKLIVYLQFRGIIEEFIQTSSVGEFKKRLHLLLSFHGQLKHGINLKAYSSPNMAKNLNILYNAFGYYVQFMPLVLEHIEAGRRCIEKDLKEYLKLFHWEHPHNYSSIDNFRRTRHKIWKLIQKYNDVLQQPLMIILNQEAALVRDKVPSWLEHRICNEMNMEVLQFPVDLVKLRNTERFVWYDNWRNKAESALQGMCYDSIPGVDFLESKGLVDVIRQSLFSESTGGHFKQAWEDGWTSLENICNHAAEFACIWKHKTKNLKKRALRDLLKVLEGCGLSRHRSIITEVNQAASFLDHLIILQHEQRYVAYGVSEQLKNLRQLFHLLHSTGFGGNISVSPNQNAVLKCMWLQKQLLDSLLAMSRDVNLLLGRVKNSHISTCTIVRVEVDVLSALIDKFIPSILKSKESLDKYFIGGDRFITTSAARVPFVVTEQIEQLVMRNFQIINNIQEDIQTLVLETSCMKSLKGILLDRLKELIDKGNMLKEGFDSEIEASSQSASEENPIFMEIFSKLGAVYADSLAETNKLMNDVLGKLDVLHEGHTLVQELSAENITLWKDLFESYMINLHLDLMYAALSKTVVAASKLVNCAAHRKPEVCNQVQTHLKHLHVLLGLIVTFAEGILSEFLDAHETIAEMTYVLAHIFALLFSKGFGSVEEPTENTACDGTQDASGTGMGEGEGINDVSDQIDNEAQLLGSSEKQDGLENSDKAPSNKDRGIEMDDDFDADTFDVSEDSGDDDVEDEETNLDSKMGETGDGSQVVDEKLWDKDEDGKPDTSIDKYESGPSVKETDSGCRELRAKDDSALEVEESGEMDSDESDGHSKEDKEPSISDDDENADDMNVDKSNAFEDPTGIQFHEEEKNLEDVNMDEPQGSDTMDGTDSDPTRSDVDMNDEDENSSPIDHINDENSLELNENTEAKGEEDAENANMDLDASKETLQSSKIESVEYPAEQDGSTEPLGDPHNIDSNADPEMHWANSGDMNTGIAPSRNLPCNEVPKMELSLPDSNDGSRLSYDQPKPQTLQVDTSPMQCTKTNPYRSIGDAMEEWKERAKVSVDPQDHQPLAHDDFVDENADEYRYVSEAEKSTTQALGAATSDQIKNSVEGNKSTAEEGYIRKKDGDRNDVLEENSETHHLKANQASIPRQKVDEELLNAVVDIDASMEEMEETNLESLSEDMVSFKSSYMDEKILPLDNFMNDKALSKTMDIEEISNQTMHKAILDWKRYELVTTRLSQELAEQLRLVMEPTLASKLQGDYRTGKRINMKKVIPYIASHFRKDKIWLRRTKPNKRDYQVVVAIDDSRSMSESLCGNVAIEALVTVCRAMSQLEVGQFAVASFGEKGNIKLLHDFDQPFTGEAGVKMISSLSFKQDNTIADEPMVDLLKYLNNMLDTAVAKARTPSGQNPLHQLILIIADGRFHEKENLKRCVRNVLNRKRMIAFILLDSPQESIMDLMEASFEGEKLSFTKYLNSFPFPYYIVLKNLEALPRTLADLLRQWFELMQSISE